MSLLKENEVKSPYDLREMLWFVIPGATLLLLVFLFEYWLGVKMPAVESSITKDSLISIVKIESDSLGSNQNNVGKRILTNIDSVQKAKQNMQDSVYKHFLDSLYQGVYELRNKNSEVHEKLRKSVHTPILTALSITNSPLFKVYQGEKSILENWVFGTVYLLLLLTICYILGHITYMIGTFLYERGMIMKGYSYPYLKLLDLKEPDEKSLADKEIPKKPLIETMADQIYHKGIYFWASTIFVALYVLYAIWGFRTEKFIMYQYLIFSVCFILLVFPSRLAYKLSNITEFVKPGRTMRNIGFVEKQFLKFIDAVSGIEEFSKMAGKLKSRIEKDKPARSGHIFWILCVVIYVMLIYTINLKDFNQIGLQELIDFIWNNGWVILSVFFLVLVINELLVPFASRSKSISTWAINGLKGIKDFNRDSFMPISEFEKEKLVYEYLFIRWYNFFGNEIDKFSDNYFHTQKKFDQDFIMKYASSFRQIYKTEYSVLTTHNYWLSKFFVMENSVHLNQQMNFWENNTRFTKSLSASFFLAFLYCSISFLSYYFELIDTIVRNQLWQVYHPFLVVWFLIPIAYFIITVCLLRYYLYLYDNRLNRMIIRSFVSLVAAKEYDKELVKKEPESC